MNDNVRICGWSVPVSLQFPNGCTRIISTVKCDMATCTWYQTTQEKEAAIAIGRENALQHKAKKKQKTK